MPVSIASPPPFNLEAFSAAATGRSGDKTLRLKEDGSGIAVSWIDRLVVYYHDKISRSDAEIVASKTHAMNIFLAAVRDEGGEKLYQIALRAVRQDPDGKPLSELKGSVVVTTLNKLTETAQQPAFANEQAIIRAAYGGRASGPTSPLAPSPKTPNRNEIVDLLATTLIEAAKVSGVLNESDHDSLKREYVGVSPLFSHQLLFEDQLPLSESIENALRSLVGNDENDGSITEQILTPKMISEEARKAATTFLNAEINRRARHRFAKKYPLGEALADAINARPADQTPIRAPTPTQIRDFERRERRQALACGLPLTPETQLRLRYLLIDEILGPLQGIAREPAPNVPEALPPSIEEPFTPPSTGSPT